MTREEHDARTKARERVEGLTQQSSLLGTQWSRDDGLPIPGLREAPVGTIGGGS